MYRVTRYQLALFLLMVKTNVGFTVVAEFFVDREEELAITAALREIKCGMEKKGFNWDGRWWMCDKNWSEKNAISAIFPGAYSTKYSCILNNLFVSY